MAVFIYVFLLIITQILTSELKEKDKLKVTLYHETLCPDCASFIVYELAPTVKKLKDRLHELSFELVPYGKVQKVGDKLHCQHGPRECAGNKLDACAIDQLITKRETPLQYELVQFITCMKHHLGDPLVDAQKCSRSMTALDFDTLAECFKGTRGEDLIAGHGNRTRALQPTLTWVPTVVINNNYNKTENMMAQGNLHQVICSYLSNNCQ